MTSTITVHARGVEAPGAIGSFDSLSPGGYSPIDAGSSMDPSASIAASFPSLPSTTALLPTPQTIQILQQVDVEGGSPVVVLAALVTFLIATVLAVAVTYRFVEGYRQTRARPILLLAIGMFLLAPAPMFIRLLVGNVAAIPLSVQLLTTTLSELCGLLVILYVVYTT